MSEDRFVDRATQAYESLAQLPGPSFEQLRWKIREIRLRNGITDREELGWTAVEPALTRFWSLPAVAEVLTKGTEDERDRILFGVLLVVIQEAAEDVAVQLCRQPPKWTQPANAVRQLTVALFAVGNSTVAEPFVIEFAAKNPDKALLRQSVADLAFFRGDYRRSAEHYRQLLQIDPENKSANGNLAAVLSQDPATRDESLQVIDGALRQHPGDADLLDTKSVVLINLGRSGEALEVLAELIARDSAAAHVYLHLAMAHQCEGDEESAKAAFLDALVMGVANEFLAPMDRQAVADFRSRWGL